MQQPILSVCIPVYGVEKYIERCARSLFEQTIKDGIEFIFVNDCTQDRSIEILKKVLSEYNYRKGQVKIIDHDKNSGLAMARQTALKNATGLYVIHCDSDDWVEPDMYEKMYRDAVSSGADIVFCGMYLDLPSGKKTTKKFASISSPHLLIERMCIDHKYASLCNKLYKRNLVSKINFASSHITIQEDFILNFYSLQNCENMHWVHEPLYHHFCNRDSSSQKKWSRKDYNDLIFVLNYIKENTNDSVLVNLYTLNVQQMLLSHSHVITSQDFHNLTEQSHFSWKIPMPFAKKFFVFCARLNFPLTSRILQFALKIKKWLRYF